MRCARAVIERSRLHWYRDELSRSIGGGWVNPVRDKEGKKVAARKVRARISPKALVETETEKGASVTRDRADARNLRKGTRKVANATVLVPVMGRKRFAECISWVSAKLETAAIASTISHAASSRRERVPRARIAYTRITSLQPPPPRATTSLETTRPVKSIRVEAEAKTGAGSEARLQARPECVELAPG